MLRFWTTSTLLALLGCAACSSKAITFSSGNGGAGSGTSASSGSGAAGGSSTGTSSSGSGPSGSTASATSSASSTTTSSSGTTTTSSSGTTTTSSSGTTTTSSSSSSGGVPTNVVYAHTDTVLFTMDPTQPSLPPTQVGAFDCLGGAGQDTSMLDLALSSKGDLWATSAKNAYQIVIQGTTAHCAHITPLSLGTGLQITGLSFVPAGVLDPAKEVLVGGDTGGNVWSINTATGILTQHGTLGVVPATDGHGHTYANVGKPWELSGDLVFVTSGGVTVGYATARDCPSPPSTAGCSPTDTLIQLDPTAMATATTGSITLTVRGQVVRPATCADLSANSYGRLYGLVAHQSTILGFSRTGTIVVLNETDGSGCGAALLPTDLWSGAAVSPTGP